MAIDPHPATHTSHHHHHQTTLHVSSSACYPCRDCRCMMPLLSPTSLSSCGSNAHARCTQWVLSGPPQEIHSNLSPGKSLAYGEEMLSPVRGSLTLSTDAIFFFSFLFFKYTSVKWSHKKPRLDFQNQKRFESCVNKWEIKKKTALIHKYKCCHHCIMHQPDREKQPGAISLWN